MFLDSVQKYRAPAEPLSDPIDEMVRKQKFKMYETIWRYYKEKAEK